jgi:hypothetical protein
VLLHCCHQAQQLCPSTCVVAAYKARNQLVQGDYAGFLRPVNEADCTAQGRMIYAALQARQASTPSLPT